MLHVISARCVARDLHTIAPWPLECTCCRQFVVQLLSFFAIIVVIVLVVVIIIVVLGVVAIFIIIIVVVVVVVVVVTASSLSFLFLRMFFQGNWHRRSDSAADDVEVCVYVEQETAWRCVSV